MDIDPTSRSQGGRPAICLGVLTALLVAAGCGAPTSQADAADAAPDSASNSAPEATSETAPVRTAPAGRGRLGAAARLGDLTVHDPRAVRFPGSGAIYLVVVNRGDGPERLLAIESDEVPIELHETVLEEGDMVRMRPAPDGFEFAAGANLELTPAGKHGMILGGLDERTTLPVTLRFAEAGDLELELPVVAPGPVGGAAVDHGDMDHEESDHEGMDHEGMDHEAGNGGAG